VTAITANTKIPVRTYTETLKEVCLRDPIFKFRDPGPPAKPFVEGIIDSGGINTVVSC